ncbi:MAG: DUF3565 domain-containing protein [Proteobacteria bacterium]|nr:MAG: DUF3565 domain-containing protein [Pseudomonadota bacterium]
MQQFINGYHLDHEGHWVAELACGHAQHVRHDPPWMIREWVTTEKGRVERIGTTLSCKRCDELRDSATNTLARQIRAELLKQYESAGISGLCHEGRFEVSVSAINVHFIERLLTPVFSSSGEDAG